MSITNPNFAVYPEVPDEQEEIEDAERWAAWIEGFHAYMAGKPEPSIPGERAGWNAARDSEGYNGMNATQLEAMGV